MTVQSNKDYPELSEKRFRARATTGVSAKPSQLNTDSRVTVGLTPKAEYVASTVQDKA